MINNGTTSGIIITDEQLDGKGQRGRKWLFQKTKSIAFSIFTSHKIDSNKIGYLPSLCALSVKNALNHFNISASLKWPNDIFLNGKKIGGILCESKINKGKSKNIIMGIGINVNQDNDDIKSLNILNAGSLRSECGKMFKREEIISTIINNLEPLLMQFPENYKSIKYSWEKSCFHLNQIVELSTNSKKIKGIFKGLGINGCAIIEKNGNSINASSGIIT